MRTAHVPLCAAVLEDLGRFYFILSSFLSLTTTIMPRKKGKHNVLFKSIETTKYFFHYITKIT